MSDLVRITGTINNLKKGIDHIFKSGIKMAHHISKFERFLNTRRIKKYNKKRRK